MSDSSLVRTSSASRWRHLADSKLPTYLNIAKSLQKSAEKQWHQAHTHANTLTAQVTTQQVQDISQILEPHDRMSHSQQSME